MRWVVAIVGVVGGVLLEVYTFQFVRIFGHLEWAERKLGPGGTYAFWRIMGIVGIFGGMLAARGWLFGIQ